MLFFLIAFVEFAFYVPFVSDIDECSSNNECDVNARCTNIIGSYNCTCKKGYGGGGRDCFGKVQSLLI